MIKYEKAKQRGRSANELASFSKQLSELSSMINVSRVSMTKRLLRQNFALFVRIDLDFGLGWSCGLMKISSGEPFKTYKFLNEIYIQVLFKVSFEKLHSLFINLLKICS